MEAENTYFWFKSLNSRQVPLKLLANWNLDTLVGPLQGFKDFVHLVNIMGSMILLAGWAIILPLNRV